MSVYAQFTYTVQRHLDGSILLIWVIWHVTFFFACRAQDYTFCLLIVRYMLSDKIKGKIAIKARTFLQEGDKKVHVFHVCYWFSIDGKQFSNIFKTLHWLPISSIRSIGILQQWSLTWSQTLNRHASGKD